jgi:hypothetical protein
MSLKALLTAGLASLLLAPSAAAFHGAPYTAHGTAVLDSDVYLIEVVWGGWYDASYTVTISDPLGALIVDHHRFPGQEGWIGGAYALGEFFFYHGWSLDPSVSFDIQGIQNLVGGFGGIRQQMLYVGNYGDYQVVLAVGE